MGQRIARFRRECAVVVALPACTLLCPPGSGRPAAGGLRGADGVLFEGVAEVGDRLEVLPVCYHLLWRQVLVADLAVGPLSPATRIRRAGGGR
jgi:hypothetical protein